MNEYIGTSTSAMAIAIAIMPMFEFKHRLKKKKKELENEGFVVVIVNRDSVHCGHLDPFIPAPSSSSSASFFFHSFPHLIQHFSNINTSHVLKSQDQSNRVKGNFW